MHATNYMPFIREKAKRRLIEKKSEPTVGAAVPIAPFEFATAPVAQSGADRVFRNGSRTLRTV